MRRLLHFKNISNTSYFLPAALAVYHQLWLTAVLALALLCFSTAYHMSNEKRFLTIDRICAWLLIIANLYLCYRGSFAFPYFPMGLILVGISWFLIRDLPDNRYYNVRHGLWHLTGSAITICSILTFLSSYGTVGK